MLDLDPKTRMSAEESLEHVWLKSHEARCREKKIHGHVMLNLHGCNKLCPLLYEMLVLFCQFLNDKDIKAIRETFQYMDEDESGTIELSELEMAYRTTRDKYATFMNENDRFDLIKNISNSEIRNIVSKVDVDRNGLIEYSEFLAHSLTRKQLTYDNVKAFFRSIIPNPEENGKNQKFEDPANTQG
jgi:calcium-dependent protein kinase